MQIRAAIHVLEHTHGLIRMESKATKHKDCCATPSLLAKLATHAPLTCLSMKLADAVLLENQVNTTCAPHYLHGVYGMLLSAHTSPTGFRGVYITQAPMGRPSAMLERALERRWGCPVVGGVNITHLVEYQYFIVNQCESVNTRIRQTDLLLM